MEIAFFTDSYLPIHDGVAKETHALARAVRRLGHGVTVFDKSGNQIDHIDINEGWTGNICFGGKDRHTLFITASTSVYTLEMAVKGVGSQ